MSILSGNTEKMTTQILQGTVRSHKGHDDRMTQLPLTKGRGIPSAEVRLLGHLRDLSSFCSISQDTPLRVPPTLPRGTAQGSLQLGGVECRLMAGPWLTQRKETKILAFMPRSLPSQIPYVPLADRPAHDPALSYTPSHLYCPANALWELGSWDLSPTSLTFLL